MPKVAQISETNFNKQMNQVTSGAFKKRLTAYAKGHSEEVDELEKAINGENYDSDKVKKLLQELANDNTIYKGLIFGYTLVQERKGQIAQGRRISRKTGDLELYRAILNHDPKQLTVSAFCRINQISRSKYYRIRNKQVSHPDDKALLDSL